MRTPMCLILCSSREPKQLLLHLTKRSHGCQRVHIGPPLHDLSALAGNDRDEPVVVCGAVRDNFTMDIVFGDDTATGLRSEHDELISAVEYEVVAVARIE